MCTWCWRISNAKEKFGLQNVAKERLSVIYIQDFWATCACPKKTRVALKCFTVWKYFYHSEFLNNLRLPWKTRVALIFFTVLKNFYHSGFLSNWRLPWNFSRQGGRPPPQPPSAYAYGSEVSAPVASKYHCNAADRCASAFRACTW